MLVEKKLALLTTGCQLITNIFVNIHTLITTSSCIMTLVMMSAL